MREVLPLLIGGLVLFLYAISQLSEILKELFSEKVRETIKKYTANIFLSILIGTVLTIILNSSSAVIILVIVFINSKNLDFKQAVGLIMGANIGTTFSSQVIALNVGEFSAIPLLIGLTFVIFLKHKTWKLYGKALLYFGMLFFGLYLVETSVLPLKDSELFTDWITRIEDNPWQGALIGGLITLIIQSSSGTVGIAILLQKQQLLSVAGGVAMMLGAELGTCSDTLIATINGSRAAIKAGVFHLSFNLMTITIGLLLFTPFLRLVEQISAAEEIGNAIANAHVIFNLLGVVIFLPFVPLLVKLFDWLIPEKTTA